MEPCPPTSKPSQHLIKLTKIELPLCPHTTAPSQHFIKLTDTELLFCPQHTTNTCACVRVSLVGDIKERTRAGMGPRPTFSLDVYVLQRVLQCVLRCALQCVKS